MGVSNPKDSSRVRGDARARRLQRQEEAAERQREYDMMSPPAKLAMLDKRAPRGAHKERAKLLRQVVEA